MFVRFVRPVPLFAWDPHTQARAKEENEDMNPLWLMGNNLPPTRTTSDASRDIRGTGSRYVGCGRRLLRLESGQRQARSEWVWAGTNDGCGSAAGQGKKKTTRGSELRWTGKAKNMPRQGKVRQKTKQGKAGQSDGANDNHEHALAVFVTSRRKIGSDEEGLGGRDGVCTSEYACVCGTQTDRRRWAMSDERSAMDQGPMCKQKRGLGHVGVCVMFDAETSNGADGC